MLMQITGYVLSFKDGGVEVLKDDKVLYSNTSPLYAFIKTATTVTEYYGGVYSEVSEGKDGAVTAGGVLETEAGTALGFSDLYEKTGSGFKISRSVKVLKTGDDLGFSTKISFTMTESDNIRDYDGFIPGAWYRQNEFAPTYAMGQDLGCEYFWKKETNYALPLCAMQNIASGETLTFSRWAADVTLRTTGLMDSESTIDPKMTIGSIGMSKPEDKTINYTYYGWPYRKDFKLPSKGLSMDYVYPGSDGQLPRRGFFAMIPGQKSFSWLFHPVEDGFTQSYTIAADFAKYDSYTAMMRDTWRRAYERLRDKLFAVDNKVHFENCMNIFTTLTRQYGDSWGLPFAAQLPHMDINCVQFQFGFVGQQPGIGYQLIRYGDMEKKQESFTKGVNIVDFWVKNSLTDKGAPYACYNPGAKCFEPYKFFPRMIADGAEAILDAYLYMRKIGKDRPEWLTYCGRIADWYLSVQNEDGSFCRSYEIDNTVSMDSKSNTPSAIRYLIQYYLTAGGEKYKEAAMKAGDFTLNVLHPKLEYRGGTCDNTDIQDKEAGIYGIFGFLALYDLTGDEKWIQPLKEAADYTETWTYMWDFPIITPYKKHPFNKYSISGQSIITQGGGADVYMAACSYTYYRIYLITGDEHYLDFAEFLHNNTRQSNDVDGSIGYIMPGLGHESGNFSSQTFTSHYHWLPWCTFVEADPISRLYDTFGVYEIADAEKLSLEERQKRNRLYDTYGK